MEKDNKIQGGFRIPENYLNGLENKIMEALSSDRETASVRGNEMKRHFRVPETYFDTLEDQILSRTSKKIIRLPKRGIGILAIAAAASVLFLIGINLRSEQKTEGNSWADLQDTDIFQMIDEDYSAFHSSDIADAFEDIDLGSDIYAEMDMEDYLEEVDLENILTEN